MFGITAFAQSSFAALGGSLFLASVAESVQVISAETSTFTAAASIDEAFQANATEAAQFSVLAGISETVQVFDTETALITTGLTIFEEVRFSATEDVQVDFVSAVSSSVNVVDTETGAVDFTVAISETVQCSDPFYEMSLVIFNDVAEAIQSFESVTSKAQFISSVTEALNVLVTQSPVVDFYAGINEAVETSAIDAVSAVFAVGVQEQIQLYEAFLGRYLWELIDNSQISERNDQGESATFAGFSPGGLSYADGPSNIGKIYGWVNESTSQNPDWGNVDDYQIAIRQDGGVASTFADLAIAAATFADGPIDSKPIYGWQTKGTQQNPGWENIEDNQTSTWVEIDTV